jgi:hypothetical protein
LIRGRHLHQFTGLATKLATGTLYYDIQDLVIIIFFNEAKKYTAGKIDNPATAVSKEFIPVIDGTSRKVFGPTAIGTLFAFDTKRKLPLQFL